MSEKDAARRRYAKAGERLDGVAPELGLIAGSVDDEANDVSAEYAEAEQNYRNAEEPPTRP